MVLLNHIVAYICLKVMIDYHGIFLKLYQNYLH